MRLLSLKATLLIGFALTLSSTSSWAAEKKPTLTGASAAMLTNSCSGCHGGGGASGGPTIPTISGLASVYFIDMMEGYKSGDIPSTIMGRMAKGYSSEEIEQMAKFYESLDFVPATMQSSDDALAEKGAKLHDKYCEKCHSELGTLADDESGFLKGQWKPYLSDQLTDYVSENRTASKKMKKKLKKMLEKEGDESISALLEFYSSSN